MKVILPYDATWAPLKWAKKNCPSYITNAASPEGKIVYYFGTEKDAAIFILRWA